MGNVMFYENHNHSHRKRRIAQIFRGDLLWDTVQWAYVKSAHSAQSDPVFIAEYGVTTYSQMLQAWNAGKVILCRHGEYLLLLYRHKANTYFSFKTSTGNRVVTRSCYLNAWEYRSEDIS